MSISGNGRIVTFSGGNSKATGDNTLQTWAYDRWTDVFTPLSTSANSPYGMYPGISSVPAINDAGTYVAWVGIDTAQPGTHFLSTVVSRPITAN